MLRSVAVPEEGLTVVRAGEASSRAGVDGVFGGEWLGLILLLFPFLEFGNKTQSESIFPRLANANFQNLYVPVKVFLAFPQVSGISLCNRCSHKCRSNSRNKLASLSTK